MQITLNNIGKRYHREWIFKGISQEFNSNSTTAIIGSNGSGKSTLLKIISAAELPTQGNLIYLDEMGKSIHLNDAYNQLSFAAPYMDLPEQLTTLELIKFHLAFKPFVQNISPEQFLNLTLLNDAKNKLVKHFSSGMKQRLKLGLAILSKTQVLLLDEPCSNLDTKGVNMYQQLMEEYANNRLIIISSNEQEEELINIQKTINITEYK